MFQYDTEARFLAVEYPLGGDFDNMVGPELVKTWDYVKFDLAFPTKGYFSLPNAYQVRAEYSVGLTAVQALRKFVRDFPPHFVPLGITTPRSAGWIRPNGDFYPGVNGHYTLAQYISAKVWGGPGGENFLEQEGWCRLHWTGQVTPPGCSYKRVTRAQIQKARSLFHGDLDPDWREALKTFIHTSFRARREPREVAEEYIERQVGGLPQIKD
jgi:hypothetical protein